MGVDLLDPEENFRWQGGAGLGRRAKRVVAGDYLDWFHWYMKWQRFNAFHVVALLGPVTRMMDDENRGFIDGLLTRLVNSQAVYRVLIFEDPRYKSLVSDWLLGKSSLTKGALAAKFGKNELRAAMLSLLFGSTIAYNRFVVSANKTLSSRIGDNRNLVEKTMRNPYFFEPNSRWFVSASQEGKDMVQTMAASTTSEEVPSKPVFTARVRREHLRSDERWLRALVETKVMNSGWFTMRDLYDYVDSIIREAAQGTTPPRFIDEDILSDFQRPNRVFLPSERILRRIVEEMRAEGKLKKTRWFKELGRPTDAYHQAEGPPVHQGVRCGQCAFFVSPRKQCRLWYLLGKSFGTNDPRWDKGGRQPLTRLELYKMKNAWRISPHSSACLRFVDKKRDYYLKTMPESCDICARGLPDRKPNPVICANCRTSYFTTKNKVRVLTAYEDRFRTIYSELAGRDPSSDLARLREERSEAPFRTTERFEFQRRRGSDDNVEQNPVTIMLFPGDTILTRDGQLFLLARRRVEAVPVKGCAIVNHGVLDDEQTTKLQSLGATVHTFAEPRIELVSTPIKYSLESLINQSNEKRLSLSHAFAVAMASSAVQATERIPPIAKISHSKIEILLQEQSRYLRRLQGGNADNYLSCEGQIMNRYWKCYAMALKLNMQQFGPRKKSRFVREHVNSPTGRAKGYSAVDAAINYLHQRRLYKMRQANSRLGISGFGDGFLHRKRWKSEGLGLMLDLADP